MDESFFVFYCRGDEGISISLLVERSYTFYLSATILSDTTQAGKE
jgi:hypothetical protein